MNNPEYFSQVAQAELQENETTNVATQIKNLTKELRQNSFVDELPDIDNEVEILSEQQSPGPWATYYFPTRCNNCEAGRCSVCGYTTLKNNLPRTNIYHSMEAQWEKLLGNFEGNVIGKQYGKMAKIDGVENPIGLTISPTGSFFNEAEFPRAMRIKMLQEISAQSEKYQAQTVLTAEAHARDITSKTQFNNFGYGAGAQELELLQQLHTQVILGFESRNDFVRNGIYAKDLQLGDFEKAVSFLQKSELGAGAFVFCGLAPMSDLEAQNDALETVRYLVEKNVFPVLMFANIQPNTMTDVLRENGKYKMLEPFTVADTIEKMLAMSMENNLENNWLVPDPVGGPPDPEFNIFLNRDDTVSSNETNLLLLKMLRELRNTRDVEKYREALAKLKTSDEYKKYVEYVQTQNEEMAKKSLSTRTQAMIDFAREKIESSNV